MKLKRVCLKGYPCGGTCISVNKRCLVRGIKSQELLKLKEMITKEKPVDAIPAGLKVREASYAKQAIDRMDEALNKVKSSWEKLPDKAQTQFKNLDDLYANARKAQKGFISIMNRGTGLDKTLGGVSAVEDFAKAEKLMQQKGPVIIVAGIKGRERAQEKIETDYKNKEDPVSHLKDVVRGTVAVDTLDEVATVLPDVIRAMEAKNYKLLQKPKNNFAKPTEAGYRDINMVFVSPDGVPVELQVNTKAMVQAKDDGHDLYDEIRTMDAIAAKNNDLITRQDWEKRRVLIDRSRAIYNQGFQKSIPPQPKSKKSKKSKLN